jgi:hypothetical protein
MDFDARQGLGYAICAFPGVTDLTLRAYISKF